VAASTLPTRRHTGQSTRRATQSDLHLTQAIAAIRESFEELGVLAGAPADGSHLGTADIAALDRRRRLPPCARATA
jgi:8-oxo-dGTP pyrophosphatase MutT (NUDIX family)